MAVIATIIGPGRKWSGSREMGFGAAPALAAEIVFAEDRDEREPDYIDGEFHIAWYELDPHECRRRAARAADLVAPEARFAPDRWRKSILDTFEEFARMLEDAQRRDGEAPLVSMSW